MGQLLGNLAMDDDIQDGGDRLGGFSILESGLVDLTVKHAYLITANSGAMGVVAAFETQDGVALNQTFYITSGTAKGKLTYWVDKKTNDKKYLPGFVLANHLCLLAGKKKINQMATEKRVIDLYNAEAKADVPTEVDMLVDLIGKSITAGVIKQLVDKQKKGDDGKYHPTGETREQNEIDKFFRQRDGLTVTEILAKLTEPVFREKWANKWTGVTQDKTSKETGTAGLPGMTGASAPVTETSLFA